MTMASKKEQEQTECNKHKNCDCHKNPKSEKGECNCKNHSSDKANEYLELAQRIKAEFDNYKKRNAELSSVSFSNGVITCVSKLLPCVDAFKQAKNNIKDESVLQGLEMILNSMLNAFNELGVKKIDAVGKDFDPNFHNVVLTDKDETQPDNVVLEEFQEGFVLGDRVIRHSVVKINKLQ